MRRASLIILVLSFSLSLFASESPFSGTWKMNPAKSKVMWPLPQSDVAVVNVDETGIKFSEEMTDEKGQSAKTSTEAKFDGKDYPLTGDPDSDSISYRRVDSNTLAATLKKGGKISERLTIRVSKDGKVTTVHSTAYSNGKEVKGITVYDKQ